MPITTARTGRPADIGDWVVVAGATVVATTVGALVTTGGDVVGVWMGVNVAALPAL